MSLPIQVTFLLADWVAKGLNDGTFERVGGVIRDVTSKKIVTWLRDTNSVAPSVISFAANPVTGVLNLIASGANLAVSAKGFSSVNQRLDGIENQIASIGQSLQFTQGILQVSTAASILNLGVSVMGFAVISQRLNEIENQLKQSQELLNKINRKIDLSFYANFRAGIELAINAFTMTKI
jgi:tetrahydromethanopterin S-methyltransferase subunit G